MPRLFLGIPIASSIKADLSRFKEDQHAYTGLRWTPEEKLHITAYFFAEVAEEMMENLKSLLFIALKNQEVFELEFDKYVLAPPRQDARMIWAQFKRSDPFLSLHEKLHALYSQIEAPIQRRKKPIPHITLARLKDQAPKKEEDYNLMNRCGNISVDRLILWKSSLQPEGSIYEAQAEYLLG